MTLAAVVSSFLVGAFIAFQAQAKWPLLLMPVALFLRMALNAIDGMLAREHGMKSPLGVAAVDYFLTSRLFSWFTLNVVGILPIKRWRRATGRSPTARC